MASARTLVVRWVKAILTAQNIVCPWHAWAFDCLTGVNDFDPEIQLKSYPVLVRDGSIFVELP